MDILVIGGGGREHAIVWKLNNRGHNIFLCSRQSGNCRYCRMCVFTGKPNERTGGFCSIKQN